MLGVRDSPVVELVFGGIVSPGVGRHSTLLVPGRSVLPQAPADWPEVLYPGSLNVLVDRYPAELRGHGLANHVVELDSGRFAPEFEILRAQFRNNLLSPRPGVPRGGDAQVWRARLSVESVGLAISCWALRRFGSAVGEQLEFVAERRLLNDGLQYGNRVQVSLLGRWRNA